jgi:uncharacterized membrane protein YidH (DUF202 family)
MPPGVARERTALAWRRTALAFAGNGILLARSSDKWIVIAAFALFAIAAGIATTAAFAFRNPNTHGWIASGKRRDHLLLFLIICIGVLDIASIARWKD